MVSTEKSYEERIRWFNEARFGIFVHWGLYAILGRGEWVMFLERIPADEYAQLAKRFKPSKFDANAWAALAKEAGAKYMVLTTRHHDGFCLFDSKVSDFTSVKTAAKRDFVAEYVEALRKAGLRVGFYYSLLDWRFPGYFDREAYPESAKALVEQAHAQVRELMTNYGKIDILWYDGGWVPGLQQEEIADFWRSRELNAMVRSLQPDIIINNRSGLPEDFDTPEQRVAASESGRAWESCMTIGTGAWGYVHHESNFRSVPQLIQYLVTAASGEGNFLLNVGPKPDGTIRREEVWRLREIGNWLAVNGESIYGSERCPFTAKSVGLTTAKGNNAYVHVFRWPKQGEITVPGIKNEIKQATVLATGQKAIVERGTNARTFLKGLPKTPPDRYDTVIKLELDGKPEAC
ncbi:MAG: alpha-L-fucosidase [Armatimonadota bacterium]|nr:alpha-L-fucosidase [Armatimonadota bacterium]